MNKSQFCVATSALVFGAAFAAPAAAMTTSYTASLSKLGEPNPTSPGTGSALVVLDDTALTIDVLVNFANLTANASAGHIHCCTAVAGTGSAGVAQGFTGFPSLTSGTYANVFTLDGASFASLAAGMAAGKAYVNIHSPGLYAGGEIRGFLTAAIPEPETYALMLAGLAAIGAVTRSRRARGK